MVKGSQVTMEFSMDRIPIMKEALEMYQKGVTTGVNSYNRELVAGAIRFEKDLSPWHKEIVYDPQTSGGLLVSVPESQGESLLKALQSAGVQWASLVGKVKPLTDSAHLVFK
jgi:selenide,water dikinase